MIQFEKHTNVMETFTSLNRAQKEAIGLLSVGTFLEYFDLMSATRSC